MYNPYNFNNQVRLDSIDNQIKNLETQKAMLQAQNQAPIVNNYVGTPSNNYEMYGVWVNSIDDLKKYQDDNKPVVGFDRNSDKFYKYVGNGYKAYKYEEIEIPTPENEIEALRKEIARLNALITEQNKQNSMIMQENENVAQTTQNVQIKRGVKNG